jgi:ATP-binding cassette subfamily F protein uup
MNLLSIENISKSYGEKPLFHNISFGINEGDKIGIIGINGIGKTTLLKIIVGLEQQDEGRLIKGSSVRTAYLSQNPLFNSEATVLDQVFMGDSPLMVLIRAYERALSNPDISAEEMIRLTREMDDLDAWSVESDAKTILTKLGILDFYAKVETLSGGQKKRVALATALIHPSDLLILDEPTNHLDNHSIDWLEEYLTKRKGALLMVTHDRYFLDRVANEIIELDQGDLYEYQGNYSFFLEKKLEREDMARSSEKKRESLLKKELAWMKRGAKARTTKQKARIDRFEALKEQTMNLPQEKLSISMAGSRLGKKVIALEQVSKSFDNRKVIDSFDYILLRDDRVGVVGPNGIGKSTLLNIISGRLQPDTGKVEVGETVRIGYFSQETDPMNGEQRAIEYIRDGAEYLTNAEGIQVSASQMMERFLFTSALQWTPIGMLSGGEKRRLYLLRILMTAPNVLLLDEPTNDLDIETLTILEDYIDDFPGAVMAVSHDRYFLDRIAGKIFSFEEDGKIKQYPGNYTDFIQSVQENRENGILTQLSEEGKKASPKNSDGQEQYNLQKSKSRIQKFTFKEMKEYETIDSVIQELEENILEMEEKMAQASTDYSLLQQLMAEKEEAEQQLAEKMDRWVYLNELAERIEKGKE